MNHENGAQHIVFNKLSVQSVESASGIFIGTTTANGWSSVRKDNSGFGTAQGGTVQHNCNIVYDNDHLDFPVDDRDVYVHSQVAPVSQSINFQTIDAAAVTSNSTIAVGDNNQSGWSSTGKNNYGEGRHKGVNLIHHNVNTIFDDDTVDAAVAQNTARISANPID